MTVTTAMPVLLGHFRGPAIFESKKEASEYLAKYKQRMQSRVDDNYVNKIVRHNRKHKINLKA